jgi:hypothetical protein
VENKSPSRLSIISLAAICRWSSEVVTHGSINWP